MLQKVEFIMNQDILNSLFNKNHSYQYDLIESPIEEFFLNHLIKYLDPETKITLQLPITTISGNFRSDIALIRNGKTVLIECDGEEHHTKDLDEWYDEWRDTLILVQQKAETIYRITGKDIYNNINSLIYIMYYYEPEFFNEEYARRLGEKEIEGSWYKKTIYYDFVNKDGVSLLSRIIVKRKNTKSDFDRFWLRYVMYSLLNPNKNIRELIKLMSGKHIETEDLMNSINRQYQELNLTDESQLLTLDKKA